MSKQPGRRPANKNRPQARKGRTAVAAKTARKGTNRTSWIIAIVVIAVGASLVFAFAKGSKSSATDPIKGRKPAPASLVKKVTTIPASVTNQVGAGNGHRTADEAARPAAPHERRQAAHPLHGRGVLPVLRDRTLGDGAGVVTLRHVLGLEDHHVGRRHVGGLARGLPEHANVLVLRLQVPERLHPVRAGRTAGQFRTGNWRRRPPSRTIS